MKKFVILLSLMNYFSPQLSAETRTTLQLNSNEISRITINITRLKNNNACVDCDLRGAQLQGAQLQNANLQGARLQGANLNDANVIGANMRKANFTRASLSGTQFGATAKKPADLTNAILNNVYATNAKFIGTPTNPLKMDGVSAKNAQFLTWETLFTNVSAINANFSGANFFYSVHENVNFSGANLSGTIFFGATLRSPQFTNATLTSTNFIGASLRNIDICQIRYIQDLLPGACATLLRLRGAMLTQKRWGQSLRATIDGLEVSS
jgi:uncharacterized protein YjbI with pentapeptide repeats